MQVNFNGCGYNKYSRAMSSTKTKAVFSVNDIEKESQDDVLSYYQKLCKESRIMKNRYIKVIILIVFAIILVIIADRNKANTTNEIFEETQSNQIAEKEAKWQIPEIDSSEDGFTVSAKALFEDGNGYGWYLCNQTGTYQFQISGENKDIYSKDLSDIVWKVYLMDKPFADVPRFIPQAGYEAVIVGNGEIEITKGTYVVVYCSQNAYEYGLNYAGDDNACYKCSLKIR